MASYKDACEGWTMKTKMGVALIRLVDEEATTTKKSMQNPQDKEEYSIGREKFLDPQHAPPRR